MTDHGNRPGRPTVITRADIARRDRESRLSKLFGPDGKSIIVALDDSAISGPNGHLVDMRSTISCALATGANGILGFEGMFEQYGTELGTAARIVNVTLSTAGPHHLRKVPFNTVESAFRSGAHAISVHVNTTSPYEPEMIENLGMVAAQCRDLRIPLFAHMYPRRITDEGKEDHYAQLKQDDPEAYAELVAHGARIGAEAGADVIKVPFTGSEKTFRYVVDSSYGKAVLMAGGPKVDALEYLRNVNKALKAGAVGVAVGRNFFERTEGVAKMGVALNGLVHGGLKPQAALAAAETAVAR